MNSFSFIGFFVLTLFVSPGYAKDSVRLKDIEVLTLYKDKWTTGRRSQPVQQLKCVGGTAGCSSYVPKVVQCYNRGFDGSDVQWECKAEMDSGYKFGEIQVTCEGYDYPDDPYILTGSCGLEYNLDYTSGGSGSSYGSNSDHYQYQQKKHKSSGLSDLVFYAIIALAIYTIYRVFVNMSDPNRQNRGGSGGGFGGGPGDGGPPPPGFRPDYYPSGDSCGGTQQSRTYQPQGQQPGFWTGLGAGGLLGYMMGNRGQGGYYANRRNDFWGGGPSHASPFGGGGHFGGGGGTRTSSGFGGTRRR